MDYHIVISPELGLSHKDFVEVWNTKPECSEPGQAKLYQPTEAEFPVLGMDAVILAVVLGMTGSAVYDLIKVVIGELVERKGGQKDIQLITPEQQPDGSQLVVAIPDEEQSS